MDELSWWHDDPLQSSDQDALDTKALAHQMAYLIDKTHSYNSSSVFSLSGPWGIGKSSIIAMCCEKLSQNDKPKWAIAHFTPWATGDSFSMMADFYSSLAGVLPKNRTEGIREGLGQLSLISSSIFKMVPIAGAPISEITARVANELLKQPSWHTTFADVSTRLRALGVPVLIVIDDLDRLQRSELVTLLKVVRLLGRFPGVTYLLAYDEKTLLSNLRHSDLGTPTAESARLFMEKVVQYPFSAPPMLDVQVLERLEAGLTAIAHQRGPDVLSGDDRIVDFLDVCLSQLRTPRAINRFLAQVRVASSLHDAGEVDYLDLISITLLRIQFPDLYASLQHWKGALTGSGTQRGQVHDLWDLPDFRPLLEAIPEGTEREDAIALLAVLFPLTANESTHGRSRQSIAHGDYFDRYFVHGVPAQDIADSEVRAAILQASSAMESSGMATLLTQGSEPRRALAMRRLRALSSDMTGEIDPVALLNVLMRLMPRLPESGTLFSSPHELAIVWASELLQTVDESVTDQDLEDALGQCSNSLYVLQVLWRGRGRVQSLSNVLQVAERYSISISEELLANLRLGDAAPLDESFSFCLAFISEFGDTETLKRRIQEELDRDLSLETLASRFVTMEFGEIRGFDQAGFGQFAPHEAPLYGESVVEGASPNETSWAGRRQYARGRAKAPDGAAS